MKKSVILSLFFFVIAILLYFLQVFCYQDYYRKYFTIINFLIFYPALLLSVFFSLKSILFLIQERTKNRFIFLTLSFPGLIFFLFFICQMIKVIL